MNKEPPIIWSATYLKSVGGGFWVIERLRSPNWKQSKIFFFTGRGFTLFEVLVTITLTGFIMLGILSALQNTAVFSRRSYARGDKERIIRLVTRRLEETVGSAYLYLHDDGRVSLLKGDMLGFSLPVYREAVLGQAGFTLRDGNLIYRWEGIRDGKVWDETIATQLPPGAVFSYLDGKTGIWHSTWQESYYPRLVRLRLKGEGGQAGAADPIPDIILPILVGTEYGLE